MATIGNKTPKAGQAKPKTPVKSRLQPLYHQVYLDLHDKLTHGGMDPDQPLPSEPLLAAKYGVSRVTVRRTLEKLAAEGLIRRIHGKGTYPVAAAPASDRANLSRVLDNLLSFDEGTRSVNLDWQMVDLDPQMQALIGDSRALRITRQRWREGEPISLTVVHVPQAHAALLDAEDASGTPIVRMLEAQGIQAEFAEQTLLARAADPLAAQVLQIPQGQAMMVLKRMMYDAARAPVLHQESCYRADRFEYRMTLSRMSLGPVARWAPLS